VAQSFDIADFLRVEVRPDCLEHAAQVGKPIDGLMAEFGVYKGASITRLANRHRKHTIHGFDSWVGLPSAWDRADGPGRDVVGPVMDAGHFSCNGQLPKVPSNVVLHKGWFEDTIPPFLEQVRANGKKPFRLLDIDCDIYVSTIQILNLCNDLIVPGTAIYFDELCDWGGSPIRYPLWEKHEYKALLEWMKKHDRSVKALSRNGAFGGAVTVTI